MNQPDTTVIESVPRTFWHSAFLCCGIIGAVLFNIVYFSFGAISPHYDMMRQPIGDLAHLHHGWIQSANCLVTGLFICVFALGQHTNTFCSCGYRFGVDAFGHLYLCARASAYHRPHFYIGYHYFFTNGAQVCRR